MKLIKINTDHYIVVDDSKIKEGDCYIKLDNNLMFSTLKGSNPHIVKKYCKKITHSTQPIEVFNWMGNSEKGYDTIKPLSLSEVKELIGEVDVEKKAELYVWGGVYLTEQEKQQTEIAYKEGYNQALEDNKDKKYTEKDMINWTMCMIAQYVQGNTNIWNKDLLRKSLPTLKTEWDCCISDGKLALL